KKLAAGSLWLSLPDPLLLPVPPLLLPVPPLLLLVPPLLPFWPPPPMPPCWLFWPSLRSPSERPRVNCSRLQSSPLCCSLLRPTVITATCSPIVAELSTTRCRKR